MVLSPNAFAWVGVALALLGIGSQFSEFRSNWLTIAFGVAAAFCLLPALTEWTGWTPMNINESRIRIFIMGAIGFVLFAGATWVYQRNAEISKRGEAVAAADTAPTVPTKPPEQAAPPSAEKPGLSFREVPQENLGIPKIFFVDFGTNTVKIPYALLERQVPFHLLFGMVVESFRPPPLSFRITDKGEIKINTTIYA